jgi:uncharacterized protein (TIGR00369 family)
MDQRAQMVEGEGDAVPEGYVRSMIPDGTFGHTLGPLYQRRDGGGFAFRADVRHGNVRGVVHGGMLMTLADQVLGLTVQQAIGGGPTATVSLNCDFVSSAEPGDLIEGTAEVTRITRSIVFVQGRLECGDRLILTAAGLWKRLASRYSSADSSSSGGAMPDSAPDQAGPT